jgi:hypothetical protein
MLLLLTLPLTAEDTTSQEAGRSELTQVEHKIAVITELTKAAKADLERHQAAEIETLDQTASLWIRNYQPYQGPIPQTSDEHLAQYPALLKQYNGFDALAPVDPWTRAWIAHRRAEHELYDRYADLRASLRTLKNLRDRMRLQLGLKPAAEP